MDQLRKTSSILALLSVFSIIAFAGFGCKVVIGDNPEPPTKPNSNLEPLAPNNSLFRVAFVGNEKGEILISAQTEYRGGANSNRGIYYDHSIEVPKFDKIDSGAGKRGLLVQRDVEYYLTRSDTPGVKVTFKIGSETSATKGAGIVPVKFIDGAAAHPSPRNLEIGMPITSFRFRLRLKVQNNYPTGVTTFHLYLKRNNSLLPRREGPDLDKVKGGVPKSLARKDVISRVYKRSLSLPITGLAGIRFHFLMYVGDTTEKINAPPDFSPTPVDFTQDALFSKGETLLITAILTPNGSSQAPLSSSSTEIYKPTGPPTP